MCPPPPPPGRCSSRARAQSQPAQGAVRDQGGRWPRGQSGGVQCNGSVAAAGTNAMGPVAAAGTREAQAHAAPPPPPSPGQPACSPHNTPRVRVAASQTVGAPPDSGKQYKKTQQGVHGRLSSSARFGRRRRSRRERGLLSMWECIAIARAAEDALRTGLCRSTQAAARAHATMPPTHAQCSVRPGRSPR